jgi:redox-sensitive bicupin YhaK (pirin superfamily)
MITLRPASERGQFDHGWLKTAHTFSFADYFDPKHEQFRALRVINEDYVQPGYGFGTHPHRDMEILTYVLEGALAHKDNMGNGSAIRPGDVQRMTAGTGVLHSEYNHSKDELVHLLQIWIFPEKKNLQPGYEQKTFTEDDKRNRLRLIASHDGRDGSVTIHQDASVYATLLEPGQSVRHDLGSGRHAWLQVARGSVTLNGKPLQQGDGAAVENETALEIAATGSATAEVLLFDLA